MIFQRWPHNNRFHIAILLKWLSETFVVLIKTQLSTLTREWFCQDFLQTATLPLYYLIPINCVVNYEIMDILGH